MNNELEILKKKLIYRAGYRGTKEMDILLSSFVNKYIETFDSELLLELDKYIEYNETLLHSSETKRELSYSIEPSVNPL